jgi:hypothetical protein
MAGAMTPNAWRAGPGRSDPKVVSARHREQYIVARKSDPRYVLLAMTISSRSPGPAGRLSQSPKTSSTENPDEVRDCLSNSSLRNRRANGETSSSLLCKRRRWPTAYTTSPSSLTTSVQDSIRPYGESGIVRLRPVQRFHSCARGSRLSKAKYPPGLSASFNPAKASNQSASCKMNWATWPLMIARSAPGVPRCPAPPWTHWTPSAPGFCRANSSITGEGSTPIIRYPLLASSRVMMPVPHPTSTTV